MSRTPVTKTYLRLPGSSSSQRARPMKRKMMSIYFPISLADLTGVRCSTVFCVFEKNATHASVTFHLGQPYSIIYLGWNDDQTNIWLWCNMYQIKPKLLYTDTRLVNSYVVEISWRVFFKVWTWNLKVIKEKFSKGARHKPSGRRDDESPVCSILVPVSGSGPGGWHPGAPGLSKTEEAVLRVDHHVQHHADHPVAVLCQVPSRVIHVSLHSIRKKEEEIVSERFTAKLNSQELIIWQVFRGRGGALWWGDWCLSYDTRRALWWGFSGMIIHKRPLMHYVLKF